MTIDHSKEISSQNYYNLSPAKVRPGDLGVEDIKELAKFFDMPLMSFYYTKDGWVHTEPAIQHKVQALWGSFQAQRPA